MDGAWWRSESDVAKEKLELVEVSPRDGLQNEPEVVATALAVARAAGVGYVSVGLEDATRADPGHLDRVVEAGGIFYALWHPDRYKNSVIYDHAAGVDGQSGSTLIQHLTHVANRKDVWYVANGWLYSYRYVAETGEK